ncbi:MAG: potassium-transporting ATPase subunit F [Clostridia bacterium]
MTRMLGGLVLLGLSIAVLVYLTYVLVRPDRF